QTGDTRFPTEICAPAWTAAGRIKGNPPRATGDRQPDELALGSDLPASGAGAQRRRGGHCSALGRAVLLAVAGSDVDAPPGEAGRPARRFAPPPPRRR